MYRCLLLVVAFLALTQVEANVKCPMAHGKTPFDYNKFTGEWYVVAGIPYKPLKNVDGEKKCVKITMDPPMTGVNPTNRMTHSYMYNNKMHNAESYVQAYSPEKSSTFYAVWKKVEETTWSAVLKKSIVATDYETYAISIACAPHFNEMTKTFSSSIHADIWSRNTTMSEETLKTLMSVLSGYDIDMSAVKKMDQTNCRVSK